MKRMLIDRRAVEALAGRMIGSTSCEGIGARPSAGRAALRRIARRMLLWDQLPYQRRADLRRFARNVFPRWVMSFLSDDVACSSVADGTAPRGSVDCPAPWQPLMQRALALSSQAGDLKRQFREQASAALAEFLASNERIVLPVCERPDVSIILVLFNQAELTFLCLQGLANTIDLPLEVIIVDNASSDRTVELCTRIDGARIIRNTENGHFLKAVNQAAIVTCGKAILLLNNDACVKPGSIASACARLQENADVGAVGGKIVLLDGRLQEAGSIIRSNGSCVSYGRGRCPSEPEFQFRRDVDYCSGAFLLVRRTLFERLNWFDTAFAPAYYEETDLCMRIREAGFRVVYEPSVEISHFEFASSSPSASIALQQRNRAIFFKRHAARLQKFHCAPNARALDARMDRSHPGRILVVDDRVPYRTLGSGFPRARSIVAAIHEAGWFITLYPLTFPNVSWDDAYTCLPRDVEIMADHGRAGLAPFLLSRSGYYDAVLVSRPHNMAEFKQAIRGNPEFLKKTKLVYDAEAIFSAREALRQELAGTPLSKSKQRDLTMQEMALVEGATVLLAVTAGEARIFRERADVDVRLLGHSVAPEPAATPFKGRSDILFVGALDDDISPNVDSVTWFVREIMPRLDRRLGTDYRVNVVGRNGSNLVRGLAGPRVRFHGAVDDLGEFYARSRLFIAPTRYAAGLPMKVHEAAAVGLPVVVTRLLANQLGWRDGRDLLAADAAENFAQACHRLYSDERLWERLRANALDRVKQDCDPAAFSKCVASVLATVSNTRASSPQASAAPWGKLAAVPAPGSL